MPGRGRAWLCSATRKGYSEEFSIKAEGREVGLRFKPAPKVG